MQRGARVPTPPTVIFAEVQNRERPASLVLTSPRAHRVDMDLDDLLQRYFGTSNLSEASPAMQKTGIDRLRVDLGLEADGPKRFALWSLLYMLGHAPDLDITFERDADRDAARNLMNLLATSGD